MKGDGVTSRSHGTTVVGVCRGEEIALAGDGQVTFGEMVVKHGARKIRTLHDGAVLAGFAGAIADALTLFEKFEQHLGGARGDLRKAAVELAKEWRTDRYLRRLDAQLIVGAPGELLVMSGEGDLLQPDDGVIAIGAGAPYAMAAARALIAHTDMSAREIALEAMHIAASLCIFTNDVIELSALPEPSEPGAEQGEPA
jgi:ATP-dependent HslUV protease subunit HslV